MPRGVDHKTVFFHENVERNTIFALKGIEPTLVHLAPIILFGGISAKTAHVDPFPNHEIAVFRGSNRDDAVGPFYEQQ
jgi:hypothetical protein